MPNYPPLLDAEQVGAYVDSAALVCGMPIPVACRPGVVANLQTILDNSAALMALDLDMAEEAAPVFRP